MKVNSTGTANAASVRRSEKGGQAKAGDFSRLLEGMDETEAPRGASATLSVDPLLNVRDATDRSGGRPRRRAEDMLDKLEDLRLGMLNGEIPREKLESLEKLVQEQRGSVTDSRLSEILDEIELRARVELAKLDIQA